MPAPGMNRRLLRAARWLASVALWIAAALALMQTLIALGVPAFVAWALAFLTVSLFAEPSSYGRRAVRRLRHGRANRSA